MNCAAPFSAASGFRKSWAICAANRPSVASCRARARRAAAVRASWRIAAVSASVIKASPTTSSATRDSASRKRAKYATTLTAARPMAMAADSTVSSLSSSRSRSAANMVIAPAARKPSAPSEGRSRTKLPMRSVRPSAVPSAAATSSRRVRARSWGSDDPRRCSASSTIAKVIAGTAQTASAAAQTPDSTQPARRLGISATAANAGQVTKRRRAKRRCRPVKASTNSSASGAVSGEAV